MTVDVKQDIRDKARRLTTLKNDESVLLGAMQYYSVNPVNFINDWCFTYDPRLPDPFVPFKLFPRQKEFINWLFDRLMKKEDGLCEKSRDTGVTWLCCAFAAWAWLFVPGIKISFGSRKEKLVDELGNPDSIFEKIRIILRTLPRIFMPIFTDKNDIRRGYREDLDAVYLRILNRANGASITGEAGDQIGRGGRSSIYFKDESAFYERPDRIEAALSQNSDVKIDVSTPNGSGNPFYRRRFSGAIPVFTLHWRDDPRKDDKWYQEMCAKFDAWIIAQEIDLDYHASIEGLAIETKWVQAAINFHEVIDEEPSGKIITGFDVADGGKDANAIVIRHGYKVIHIDGWTSGDAGTAMSRTYRRSQQYNVDLIQYDLIGIGAGAKTQARILTSTDPNAIDIRGIGMEKLLGNWEDGKKNVDLFKNFKALMWWTLRRRFEKTYQHRHGIREYDTDELISIPNHGELIQELSQPRGGPNDTTGKIEIESKTSLKNRGIKSHNYADALCLAFAPKSKYNVGAW